MSYTPFRLDWRALTQEQKESVLEALRSRDIRDFRCDDLDGTWLVCWGNGSPLRLYVHDMVICSSPEFTYEQVMAELGAPMEKTKTFVPASKAALNAAGEEIEIGINLSPTVGVYTPVTYSMEIPMPEKQRTIRQRITKYLGQRLVAGIKGPINVTVTAILYAMIVAAGFVIYGCITKGPELVTAIRGVFGI